MKLTKEDINASVEKQKHYKKLSEEIHLRSLEIPFTGPYDKDIEAEKHKMLERLRKRNVMILKYGNIGSPKIVASYFDYESYTWTKPILKEKIKTL